MTQTIYDLLIEFMEKIDEIYGLYLDSTQAFYLHKTKLETDQIKSSEKLNVSISYLDTCKYIFGIGDPNNPSSIILHECSQLDLKKRNDKGGMNYKIAAHLLVTSIFHYWEDYYRNLMASSIGISKSELKLDIFGDLRYFRQSIIHHRAISLPEMEKCKILKWFKEGDEIILTEEQIQQVIYNVKTELNNITEKYNC